MSEAVKTYTLDAKQYTLGRLATEAANFLRGKGKKDFVYNKNIGDKVVIINSIKVSFTGRKMEQKKYSTHSGYLGNLKQKLLKDIFPNNSELIIKKAISGMLPKNRLRKSWLKNLSIYKNEANEKVKIGEDNA